MDRLKIIPAAMICFLAVSCSKTEDPESSIRPDDLVVSVLDVERQTKTVLVDSIKTNFATGDKIVAYDNAGYWGRYKYRTSIAGKEVFQKDSAQADFAKTNIVAAFYPADNVDSYTAGAFTASFDSTYSFVENSFPKGAAPMAWFGNEGDEIQFKNCFGVVRIGIKYDSIPEVALKVDTISLISSSSKLYGTFSFTKNGSDIDVAHTADGDTLITLSGCEAAGELSTSIKYFYMCVPGISSASEVMKIKVKPTTDVPFSGKFTATSSGANKIAKNNILLLEPFVLKQVKNGSSSFTHVDDWVQLDTIRVGQITVSKSELSLTAGTSKTIQIFGVTDISKIHVGIITGSSSFDAKITEDSSSTPHKYYIEITGKAAGSGEVYVNDEVTNSGSYIYITVK